MQVEARYYGLAYEATGKRFEKINLTAETIQEFLEELTIRYPKFKTIMYDPEAGVLKPFCRVTKNGKPIRQADLVATITEGDVFLFIPPASGGMPVFCVPPILSRHV